MAFSKPSITFAGVHCPNCRCPELGMNSMNRLCKASAKKGSKWYKEPPCEWCKAAPTVVGLAHAAMDTCIENWGAYINDEASWWDGYNGLQSELFEIGERITAPFQVPGGKEEHLKGVVIGRFKDDHGPLHLCFDNGMHTYCLRGGVRKEDAVVPEPAFKSGHQTWEAAINEGKDADLYEKKKAAVNEGKDADAHSTQPRKKGAGKKEAKTKAQNKSAVKMVDDEESEEVLCTEDNWPTRYRLSHGQRVVATSRKGNEIRGRLMIVTVDKRTSFATAYYIEIDPGTNVVCHKNRRLSH
jgi:hypothetical protein